MLKKKLYLRYKDKIKAEEKRNSVDVKFGLPDDKGTDHYAEVVYHQDGVQAALHTCPKCYPELTADEIKSLVPISTLRSNGWFPPVFENV